MKKIAVHSGEFHADDVFAIAILKLIFSNVKVIRTRDSGELKKCDMRVDVGRVYNSETNDFDHHQKGGAGERKNKIPYAAAGLVWKHFWKKLVSSVEVFNYIDKKIIQYIDANDSGVETYDVKKVEPYTIADFVKGLNPEASSSGKVFDKCFDEVVSIVLKLMTREIEKAELLVKSKKVIREKIKKGKDYIVLGKYMPWKEVVVEESDVKFVVYNVARENQWYVFAVPVSVKSFKNRKDFPKAWAGLINEDFQKVTGVKDAKFCHNNLFVVAAVSKKGAMKLAELALKG